jgi:bacteriorhodopsin
MKIETSDYIGLSFYITKFCLFFTALFLLLEKKNINDKFKTSNNVSIIILTIAATHYYYMKNIWLKDSTNPIVYRYMDWFLTVPLQIIEFYLIVSIINKVSINIFYKLLVCSILMLLFGFLGEINILDRNVGFILGSIFWCIIIYEIYYGTLAQKKNKSKDKKINFIYNNLKYIITYGWLIYPLGYLLNNNNMIIIYNFADFINKILFALIIWFGAKYINN